MRMDGDHGFDQGTGALAILRELAIRDYIQEETSVVRSFVDIKLRFILTATKFNLDPINRGSGSV